MFFIKSFGSEFQGNGVFTKDNSALWRTNLEYVLLANFEIMKIKRPPKY